MAKDFQASQLRTAKIIASGTLSTQPSLLIYSASAASDVSGGIPASMLTNAGTDVWLFVSGTRGTSTRGTVLFGGDVTLSGTLSISILSTASFGDVYAKNLYVSGTSIHKKMVDIGVANDISPTTGSLVVRGGPNAQAFFKSGSQTIQLIGTGTSGSGAGILFGDSSASFGVGIFEDQDDKLLIKVSDRLNIEALSGVGINRANPTYGLDVNGTLGVSGGLTANGTLYVAGASSLVGNLDVTGSAVIAGNLTVNGTTTTINVTNLTVKDPLVYIGSGTTSSNQNGGIALASGSNTSAQALVFGRVANDTWGTGKQDVTAGTTSDLTTMTLVPVRSSKFEAGSTSTFVSSSNGQTLELSASTMILVMSGGNSNSNDPRNNSDSNFFVSGSKGSSGTTTRGVAIFGGDLVVSGNISGSFLTTDFNNLYVQKLYVSGNTLIGDSQTDSLIVSSTAFFGRSLDIGKQSLTVGGPAVTASLVVRGGPNAPIFFGSGSMTVHLVGTGANGSGAGIIFGDYYSDTGTGIFEDQDDRLLVKAGKRINIEASSEGVGINKSVPSAALHVGGDARIDTNLTVNGNITLGDASADLLVANATPWFLNNLNSSGSATIGSGINTVMILSGGAGSSINPRNFTDTNFFVSGAVGSKNSSTKGTTVFGGDVLISGSLFSAVSGSHTKLSDGTSFIIAGTNVTITTGTLGAITIAASDATKLPLAGGTLTGNVTENAAEAILTLNSSTTTNGSYVLLQSNGINVGGFQSGGTTMPDFPDRLRLRAYRATGQIDFTVGGKNAESVWITSSGKLYASSSMVVTGTILVVTGGMSGSLTRLSDGTSFLIAGSNMTVTTGANGAVTLESTGGGAAGASFFSSTTNGSIFTTGSVAFAGNEAGIDAPSDKGDDVVFYVSGSKSGIGTSAGKVSVFGGDVVMSGTLWGEVLVTGGISGSLTKLSDGTSYLIAGSNVTITTGALGSITINSTAAGGGGSSFFVDSVTGSIYTTGSVAFVGTENVLSASQKGSDVFFYVSGSKSGKDTATGKVAVFGGDIVVSGVLWGGVAAGTSTTLTMRASKIIIGSGTLPAGPGQSGGNDVNTYFSGSRGSKNVDNGLPGTVLFNGDVAISGSFYGTSYTTKQVTKVFADSPYTISSTDYTVWANATGGAMTINLLPAAGVNTGRILVFKKIDASGNAVTIDGNGAEIIESTATQTLSSMGSAITIQSDGTQWFKLSGI